MKEKNTHGGARANAGAPRKSEVEQSNFIFISAIKDVYNAENDEDARKEFVKELLTFERGKMFIAEHVFGKPKQIVEQTNINIEEKDLTSDEIKLIRDNIKDAY
jgi:hypothetical protein